MTANEDALPVSRMYGGGTDQRSAPPRQPGQVSNGKLTRPRGSRNLAGTAGSDPRQTTALRRTMDARDDETDTLAPLKPPSMKRQDSRVSAVAAQLVVALEGPCDLHAIVAIG